MLITFYRIYNTGREIDLDRLERELAQSHDIARPGLSRVKTKSIILEVPPLMVALGTARLSGNEVPVPLRARAKIYDIGSVSISLSLEVSADSPGSMQDLALQFAGQMGLEPVFQGRLEQLKQILVPILEHVEIDPDFFEDYTIFWVQRLEQITDPVVILLGEKVSFSQQTRQEVLKNSLSYEDDDLAVISWDTALLCDPELPLDLMDLIEFANVQLAELRYYDEVLNRQMDKLYDDIESADRLPRWRRLRLYHQIMSRLAETHADIAGVTEKVKNLIKVTEDIYYARVYETSLRVLRTSQWMDSVTRKMEVINQNYRRLSDEVNIQHSNFLEWTIIVLIALEFGLAIIQSLI